MVPGYALPKSASRPASRGCRAPPGAGDRVRGRRAREPRPVHRQRGAATNRRRLPPPRVGSRGPVVGGLLVAASWRWVFLVNVPVGLLALIIGWQRLPRVPGHSVPVPDTVGALLMTGGVGALVLGLVKGGSWGWGDVRTVTALV